MKLIPIAVISTIILSLPAWANSRVYREHGKTAAALACLVNHDRECGLDFVSGAAIAIKPWLWSSPRVEFDLGPLVSWEYVGTQSQNFFTSRYLHGRTADVYHVKYKHQDKTFYIVPPGPDGKVQYIAIQNGAPDDEIAEYWGARP